MRTHLTVAVVIALAAACGYATADVASAVHGTVEKVDAGAKIVAVKTDDGIEHSFRFGGWTVVHGASQEAAKTSWHGLEKGTDVVVHYTRHGSEDTAVDIDRVVQGRLKVVKGTVPEMDHGAKRLVVDTGDGGRESFRMTDHATEDAGKDMAGETGKGTKVIVYYSEQAGKKVAHFFEGI